MKIQNQLVFLFLSLIAFTSCDEIDELTEFDVDGNASTTFSISVAEDPNGEPQTFTQSSTINIAEDPDIQDNLSAIENVTINSLTYEINNFTGAEGAVITSASINFGATNISVADIDIAQVDAGNQVFSVTNSSELNAIAAALQNNPVLTVTLSGTVNNTPVDFDVIVRINVTVTVDPV